jgi:hypothetical protein
VSLRRSEWAAVAVIAVSVLVTGGGLAMGAGSEPKPAAAPPTTERPALPAEEVPTTEPDADGGGTGTGTGAVTEATRVTIAGIGPLTLGLTLDEVEGVTGVDFDEAGEAGCTTASPVDALAGLELLLVDGDVAAISFGSGAYKTLSGIGIGATEEAVLSTYAGQIEQAENTLTFVPRDPTDADFRIVFRTDGGSVTGFSAGRLPEVVEGCP